MDSHPLTFQIRGGAAADQQRFLPSFNLKHSLIKYVIFQFVPYLIIVRPLSRLSAGEFTHYRPRKKKKKKKEGNQITEACVYYRTSSPIS